MVHRHGTDGTGTDIPEPPAWELEGRAIAKKYRLVASRVLPHGSFAAMQGHTHDEIVAHMELQAKKLTNGNRER